MSNELLIVCCDQKLSSMLISVLSTDFSLHKCIIDLPTLNEMESISPSLTIIEANLFDKDPERIQVFYRAGYKTLMYGGCWPDSKQIKAYTEGMSGYCAENANRVIITEAVKSILKGDIWIKHNLISTVINSLLQRKQGGLSEIQPGENPISLLSRREIEVVKRVQTGESNREISDKLFISERTVKAHFSSIFKKLNVPDRLHLVIFLQRHSM
jgi:two-component system nitrate/nitrite response regulator NarL